MKIQQGRPETFGWVRSPDFDYRGFPAYERPDGLISAFPPGIVPVLTRVHPNRPPVGATVVDGLTPEKMARIIRQTEQNLNRSSGS